MLHSFGSTRCFSPFLHKFQQGSSSSSLKLHYDVVVRDKREHKKEVMMMVAIKKEETGVGGWV